MLARSQVQGNSRSLAEPVTGGKLQIRDGFDMGPFGIFVILSFIEFCG